MQSSVWNRFLKGALHGISLNLYNIFRNSEIYSNVFFTKIVFKAFFLADREGVLEFFPVLGFCAITFVIRRVLIIIYIKQSSYEGDFLERFYIKKHFQNRKVFGAIFLRMRLFARHFDNEKVLERVPTQNSPFLGKGFYHLSFRKTSKKAVRVEL